MLFFSLKKKKKKVIKQKAADLSTEKTGVLKFPIMWALFYVKETEEKWQLTATCDPCLDSILKTTVQLYKALLGWFGQSEYELYFWC